MTGMSNTRRSDAETSLSIAKFWKVLGWTIITGGVLFSLTIIGALIGIPMIGVGCVMVFFFSRMFQKRGDAMLRDIEDDALRMGAQEAAVRTIEQ